MNKSIFWAQNSPSFLVPGKPSPCFFYSLTCSLSTSPPPARPPSPRCAGSPSWHSSILDWMWSLQLHVSSHEKTPENTELHRTHALSTSFPPRSRPPPCGAVLLTPKLLLPSLGPQGVGGFEARGLCYGSRCFSSPTSGSFSLHITIVGFYYCHVQQDQPAALSSMSLPSHRRLRRLLLHGPVASQGGGWRACE